MLFLRGDLGAGKTTLVKGIAQVLDAADPDEVTSPTFTLVHEYDGKRRVNGKDHDIKLYHIDLYRIPDERQLETIGFDELATENAIVLVEWGEKFPSVVKRARWRNSDRTCRRRHTQNHSQTQREGSKP